MSALSDAAIELNDAVDNYRAAFERLKQAEKAYRLARSQDVWDEKVARGEAVKIIGDAAEELLKDG